MEKKSLGKGIEALIPVKETVDEKFDKAVYLKLEDIKPNPFQPRQNFDTKSLEELTQSIKEKGIIQPVLVRRKGANFELIAGERRFRAANLLNIKEIPAIIKDVDDAELLKLSLVENLQREDLNPIEEAQAFRYLKEKFNLTQEEIADIIGKSRVSVANTLRLLNLPQEIQEEIRKGTVSFAHGRLLLELSDANQQRTLLQKIIANSLSVRELENLVRKTRPQKTKTKKIKNALDPYLLFMEEELRNALGTKVLIHPGRKGGFIRIDFYSKEELERILKILKQGEVK